MNNRINAKEDLEKRMQKSGIFNDMTFNNFEEKLDLFLKSESSEQAEKDLKIIQKIKKEAKERIEKERYENYMSDARVLTAIDKFMKASIENRDAALVEVIRVLNNAKNKYDMIKMKQK